MDDDSQQRDVVEDEVDKSKAQKNDVKDKILDNRKKADANKKDIERLKKQIVEVNKADGNKRAKINELNKTIKAKEEREVQLSAELEKLQKNYSQKEKGFADTNKELQKLKSELKKVQELMQTKENDTFKQEQKKSAELIKQAEIASKKQGNPDIVVLVKGASDNLTRELLLKNLINKKVDTIKSTSMLTFSTPARKDISPLSAKMSDISRLQDSDPEFFEDLMRKAEGLRWRR
jgi:chromosome segregation ATPase